MQRRDNEINSMIAFSLAVGKNPRGCTAPNRLNHLSNEHNAPDDDPQFIRHQRSEHLTAGNLTCSLYVILRYTTWSRQTARSAHIPQQTTSPASSTQSRSINPNILRLRVCLAFVSLCMLLTSCMSGTVLPSWAPDHPLNHHHRLHVTVIPS
jgi:hypothetical protein